jgi:uncharacterized membrane protein YqjE
MITPQKKQEIELKKISDEMIRLMNENSRLRLRNVELEKENHQLLQALAARS